MSVQVDLAPNGEKLRISGHLGEKAAPILDAVVPNLAKTCVINLAKLDTVSSLGIVVWLKFLDKVCENTSISFEECSSAFIDQVNMIPGFLHKAPVKSVLVPLICHDCSTSKQTLVPEQKFKSDNSETINEKCDQCGRPMTPEIPLSEYFAFAG